jgi:transposase
MEALKKRTKRSKYDFIDTQKRVTLLNFVTNEGRSVKESAEILKINYSTAKTILQFFRRTGRIERLNNVTISSKKKAGDFIDSLDKKGEQLESELESENQTCIPPV